MGYAPDEALSNEELVREKYRGIGPAPGFAMMPTSAVSGYYFAHPQAEYFGVARIAQDQVADYARRRGIPLELAEKYLRPNVGY